MLQIYVIVNFVKKLTGWAFYCIVVERGNNFTSRPDSFVVVFQRSNDEWERIRFEK